MPLNGVYLIGLTGNIACGKSSVLELLRGHGAHVIDADRVTHELQQPGQPVYAQIVTAFGTDILTAPDGPIDRRKLGAIVFADPAALRRLEQIVHPAVHMRLQAWLENVSQQRIEDRGSKIEDRNVDASEIPSSILHPPSSNVAVIDAIKLLESGWKQICDAIWVVTCTPEQQLERLVATRGMSVEEARGRIAVQPPQAEKVAHANVVIDNSGSLEETRQQVEAAWQAIVRASESGATV